MILASIILYLCAFPVMPGGSVTRPATQSSSPAASQGVPVNSGQTPKSEGSASQASGTQQAPAANKAGTAHRRKKKPPASGCDTAASSGADTKAQNPGANGSAPAPASKPCAPPKIVVRLGGTSEPSIQLAGGPNDDHTTKQRNDVNQLLGVTEQNLKKVPASQLTGAQQDTVAQIRQFMQQSRSAVTDGDWERARTLAWKAEMLSEDLIKPQE